MIEVGIVGATGYTGAELLRLLLAHPHVRIAAVGSRQHAGQPLASVFPHLRGQLELAFVAPESPMLADCRVVFFATPHGTAMNLAPPLLQAGRRVIDLSADFRLRDPRAYLRWYQLPHACPELLAEAVYGLPELNAERLRSARLVACPGCYPTAVLLAALPLVRAGAVEPELIADCISGVSGAGREAKLGSLFCEAGDNLRAYGVSGHRHLPEIEQELSAVGGAPLTVRFVPHLAPLIRGIHATVHANLHEVEIDPQALYEQAYAGASFVDVLPQGVHPETRSVRGSPLCRLAVHRFDPRHVVVLSVIDNLARGSASQALQCFNLMSGLPEAAGLEGPPLWP